MLDKLTINLEQRPKLAFHASDYGKADLDLYFAFTGEPVTNPAAWYETLKWGAGRGVEDQMLKVLKDSGIVAPEYDQKEHGRVVIEHKGIKIHGYIDAKSKTGRPIEIKSVNNKNNYDLDSYEKGYPKENYVGQLATYMEYTQADEGALFVSSIDGLRFFWLPIHRVGDKRYKCGQITIDLGAEYDRWANLFHNNVVPRVCPDIWQYRYKYPVDEIDWTKVSAAKISAARNNHAVVGDWQITYSPWKDRIIELQGTHPGYNNEELAIILEKTAGYTTWKKTKSKSVPEDQA